MLIAVGETLAIDGVTGESASRRTVNGSEARPSNQVLPIESALATPPHNLGSGHRLIRFQPLRGPVERKSDWIHAGAREGGRP
jgi:hypothetical protein